MILNNVKLTGTDEPVNIRVDDGKITGISSPLITDKTETLQLTFNNAIIFPGLINSHDHLDFNLFPQLGNSKYSNYTEWGKHINQNYKDEIAAVLKIPVLLRSEWGVFKNLLCGVTTVVNHGELSGLKDAPITVFEETQVLHSVQFEKSWRTKLNNPFKAKLPVAIHVGEGSDWLSSHEIDQLTRWNLLRKKLIGIHAVAMSENQAKKFEALVWCPHSNYFLLNKTAHVNLLQKNTDILFGTDSTLTSTWDIWEHLLLARKTGLLNDETLYKTLNQNAAKTWELNCGEIAAGKDADLVVAKINLDKTGFDSFFSLGPVDLLLVIHRGNIRLFDETLLTQLSAVDLNNFSKIYLDGVCKYVEGDLPGLIEKIKGYYREASFPVSTIKAA
jgi:cytosine/adenosine deaminase-related metal-dependent hydrolase